MTPFGRWMMVIAPPCAGCGRSMSGAARKIVQGERLADGTWVFWKTWEFSCGVCFYREDGVG